MALAAPASALAVPAGVAEKLDVGGAWVGSLFVHREWRGLNAQRARLAVPWDIALVVKALVSTPLSTDLGCGRF